MFRCRLIEKYGDMFLHAVWERQIEIVDMTIDLWDTEGNDIFDEYYYRSLFPAGFIDRDKERAKKIILDLRDLVHSPILREDTDAIFVYVMYHMIDAWFEGMIMDKMDLLPEEIRGILSKLEGMKKTATKRDAELLADMIEDAKDWFVDKNSCMGDLAVIYDEDYIDETVAERAAEEYLKGTEWLERNGVDIRKLVDLLPNGLYEKVMGKLNQEDKKEENLHPSDKKKGKKNRDIIFISHCSKDRDVAEMLHDFLALTGINEEMIKCSSIPGNDVEQRFPTEIKDWLDHSVVNIAILSRDYYESQYCLNEAGVLWYKEDTTPVILIGLPEINENELKGFLDQHNLIRRLDDDKHTAQILQIIHEAIGASPVKPTKLIDEQRKLKKTYKTFLSNRSIDSKLQNNRQSADKEKTEKSEVKDNRHNGNEKTPEQYAKHLAEISSKIRRIMIDTSWVKTNKDRLELGKNPHLKFRTGTAMLIDPAVNRPDYNNGMIKVEPYDLSLNGILVRPGSGEFRKKINIHNSDIINADILEEINYKDILDVLERLDPDNPYPTLLCRFTGLHPYSRTVYVDRNTGKQYDSSDPTIKPIEE